MGASFHERVSHYSKATFLVLFLASLTFGTQGCGEGSRTDSGQGAGAGNIELVGIVSSSVKPQPEGGAVLLQTTGEKVELVAGNLVCTVTVTPEGEDVPFIHNVRQPAKFSPGFFPVPQDETEVRVPLDAQECPIDSTVLVEWDCALEDLDLFRGFFLGFGDSEELHCEVLAGFTFSLSNFIETATSDPIILAFLESSGFTCAGFRLLSAGASLICDSEGDTSSISSTGLSSDAKTCDLIDPCAGCRDLLTVAEERACCAQLCGEEGQPPCPADQECNENGCCMPLCGNGEANEGEECGDTGLPKCSIGSNCSKCKCVDLCGNGMANEGEACGDPGTKGCGQGFECHHCICLGTLNNCGNGVIDLGEDCDPNFVCLPGQPCPVCRFGCDVECHCAQPPAPPGPTETLCSDGIDNDGDTGIDCADQEDCCPTSDCSGNLACFAPPPGPPAAGCGNGIVEEDEQCEGNDQCTLPSICAGPGETNAPPCSCWNRCLDSPSSTCTENSDCPPGGSCDLNKTLGFCECVASR